ncbi:MAG: sugar ABC transporter substrate-binding protein [Blastocatellia bacterium]|nr:MAG: sugar ABC transporter substrate-binding protein [Blastocatellia bacterium]
MTAIGMALIALGCARTPQGDRIAVFTKNQTNPFFQSVRLGADNAAKQLGATIVHYIPTQPDSIPEQMSQIEDVVTKRPSAVVFVPVDSKAMVPGVQKMNAARIPVINIVDHSVGGQILSWIGADEYTMGLMTGRYLLTKMKGQGNYIIIEGVRGSLGSSQRIRGFQKALEENPQAKLLASQPGNFQRLQALQVTENLLQAHPTIDGVMAANDAMAMGVIEALDAANRKALVVGLNATKEAIDAIKAGKLLASGEFSGYLQGCFGTMAAIRSAHNLPVPKEFNFPPRVIDSTNYQELDVPDSERECPKWESVMKPDL